MKSYKVAGFKVLLLVTAIVFALTGVPVSGEEAPAKVSYYHQIRPILQANCQGCHQPARAQGGYVMTDFEKLIAGGESGDKAIISGKPDESYLIDEITPIAGKASMPKNAPALTESEIKLIAQWISEGAHNDTPPAVQVKYDPEHPPVYARPAVISSLDFSPDGTKLAVAGHHEVLLVNPETGALEQRYIGLAERINTVKFSPTGDRLLAVGGQPARMGEIQIWNLEQNKLIQSISSGFDVLGGASWSPQGDLVSVGGTDKSVRVFDAKTGKQVLFQGAHDDWALDTVFSPDQSHLVSVGRDMSVKLIEVATQRFVDNITSITPGALKGGVNTVDRHPGRDEVVIGGSDGVVKVYRMQRLTKRVIGDDANLIRRMPAMKGRIFDVSVSKDGKRIVAASSLDGKGYLAVYSYEFDSSLPADMKKVFEKRPTEWNKEEAKKAEEYWVKDVKLLASLEVPETALFAVALHPVKNIVAVGGLDGMVRYLQIDDLKLVQTFTPSPLGQQTAGNKLVNTEFQILSAEASIPIESRQLKELADLAGKSVPVLPTSSMIQKLQVEPASILIDQPFASAQVLVSGILANGSQFDLTRAVSYEIDQQKAFVTKTGKVRPVSNGETQLKITYGDKTVLVPVKLSNITTNPEISFIRDVNPILSRLGCNQGTCHGSAQGKNGFKLSLRGYDPIFDIRGLEDDHACRRINTASPDDSLMLLKPTGAVPHEGGVPYTTSDPYYQVLRKWIVDGAKLELKSPKVTKVEITPQNPIIEAIGSQQQVRVVAHYTDGTVRDVTHESFIDSGNTEVAITSKLGVMTAVRRGEAPILARYEGSYAATTLTVMGDRTGFVWKEPETYNKIDELVADKWERMKILPAELCTDAEFIRRVMLDLTGLPPTADEVRAFIADKTDSRLKREALIDRLIGSEAYVEHWSNKWADLLQVNGKFLAREGASSFREWIKKNVAENKPYNEFVKEIIASDGSNREHPEAAYYKILRTPDAILENSTHLFLSIRFNCNKCHDHPFERWTQDQYYETAAYFARTGLKEDPESKGNKIGGSAVENAKPLYEIVYEMDQGEVKHDRTGVETAPKFPFNCNYEAPEKANRRQEFAAWVTSADNPYFAKTYVNRLWGYMQGVGIIEPLDDVRAGNPPSNPELLNYLTAEFIKSGFNQRHVLSLIAKSRTYQLSIQTNQWNVDDKINFSHATARRLPAETLLDAIFKVTGSQTAFPGMPKGMRAASLPDSEISLPDGFLGKFGKPVRESTCECERSNEVQLGPVMALISGPTVSNAINATDNKLKQLTEQFKDDKDLIRELYLIILNRPATDVEVEAVLTSWQEITADHLQLEQILTKREAEFKLYKSGIEEQRNKELTTLRAEFESYKTQIAPQEQARSDAREKLIAEKKQLLEKSTTEIPKNQAAWEKEMASNVTWYPLLPEKVSMSGKDKDTKFSIQPDRSIFVTTSAEKGTYTVIANTSLVNITGIRLEAIPDDRLKMNGPGLSENGNFVITELYVQAAPAGTEKYQDVGLHLPISNANQRDYNVVNIVDGDRRNTQSGYAISPNMGYLHWITAEAKQPFGFIEGTKLKIEIDQYNDAKKHLLGRFRLSITTNKGTIGLTLPEDLQTAFNTPPTQRTKEQSEYLTNYFVKFDYDLNKQKKELAAAEKPLDPDAGIVSRQRKIEGLQSPIPDDPKLLSLRNDFKYSSEQQQNPRLTGVQDLVWALINSPEFLFNH